MVLGATPVAMRPLQSANNPRPTPPLPQPDAAAFIENGATAENRSRMVRYRSHQHIWYGKSFVNPYLTISKVDSNNFRSSPYLRGQ